MATARARQGDDGERLVEPIEQSETQNTIKIGQYDIEFYASKFNGVGFAFLIGEGIFYKSIRVEIVIPLLTFGFHVIKMERD